MVLRHFCTNDSVIRVGKKLVMVFVHNENIEWIIEILEDLKYDIKYLME